MATLLLMLLLLQEEPVQAEKVWKGLDWNGSRGGPLIRTRAEWDALWKNHKDPVPDVDFEKSVVLAIFCGSYGSELGLEEVSSVAGGTVVIYSNPAKGVPTGKPFGHAAYLLVQLPKRAEKISLKVRWKEVGTRPERVRTEDDPRLEWQRRDEAKSK